MIRSVRAFHIGGAAPPEVASARGAFGERRGVLLEIGDGERLAYGEASPLPGFSRESTADVARCVTSFPWASLVVPTGPRDVAALPVEESSLRFALELALLSLLAQREGSTVPDLLASGAPSLLGASVLIGSLGDEQLVHRAKLAASRGAVALKVKASRAELQREGGRLAALREAMGSELELRLDFNGTLADLSREEIVDALRSISQANVAFVEEPWNGPRLLELGELPVPWYADESLADASLREKLQACPDVGGFVLKPSLLGLFGAWRLGVAAHGLMRHVVVSHLFEGSVALEACADLAFALASLSVARAPGLDAHAALPCFDLPPPPAFASGRAEVRRASSQERGAFSDAVRERFARERPFFEWTS